MMGSFDKMKSNKKQKSVREVSALFIDTPQIKEVEISDPKLKEKKIAAIR